ncbi:unnamed protein product [Notodromas monacha]|uniref:Aurora kinase n=1 Tax=Notodromas monacha TaxID=399045 RepID=A0A7R9BLW1_9CRUS|nr:unnamed protein product [Notodromas monacha]CAG0917021.1 unnamed protein product [Notodromas monacha]
MNVSELRVVFLHRRYLYGESLGRSIFKFWKKKTALSDVDVSLECVLESLAKFRLRWGKVKLGFFLNPKFEFYDRAVELRVAVVNLLRNHIQFKYRRVFFNILPKCREAKLESLAIGDVLRFLRRCILRVIPPEFFGSSKNLKHFTTKVLPLFFGHRCDQLLMSTVFGAMETDVLNDGSSSVDAPFGKSYVISIAWLLRSYVSPLISSFFYVTETCSSDNRLHVFYKKAYLRECSSEVKRLVENGTLVTRQGPSCSTAHHNVALRFLRKPDGSWRQICVILRGDTGTRARMQQVRKKLNPELKKCVQDLGEMSSCSISEIYTNWISCVNFAKALGKPLFFAKIDVSSAYPNIDHELLREILVSVLDQKKIAVSVVENSRRARVKWRKQWYSLEHGVPQGSFPTSSMLCEIYYTSLFRTMFENFTSTRRMDGEMFGRYHDDVLFASTDSARVERFLLDATTSEGCKGNVCFQKRKTVTNITGWFQQNDEMGSVAKTPTFFFCGSILNPAVPVILPKFFRSPLVFVRCPLFSELTPTTTFLPDEEIVQRFLSSRKVMLSQLRWLWNLKDLERRMQVIVLRQAFYRGFLSFKRIVTKTSAICFGSHSIIWEKYPELLAKHFEVLIRACIRLYRKYGSSVHGTLSHHAVIGIALEMCFSALKENYNERVVPVVKALRDIVVSIWTKPAKGKKPEISKRVRRMLRLRRTATDTARKVRVGKQSEGHMNEVQSDCVRKLKSLKDVGKHLNGKRHMKRYEELSNRSVAAIPLEPKCDDLALESVIMKFYNGMRASTEDALRYSEAAAKIINLVRLSTPTFKKSLIRVEDLANDFWPNKLTVSFVVILLKVKEKNDVSNFADCTLRVVMENEDYVIDSDGVLYSSYLIARVLWKLSVTDDAWKRLSTWLCEVLVIWGLKRADTTLRCGAGLRRVLHYIAVRLKDDVQLKDPVSSKPLFTDVAYRERLSASAQRDNIVKLNMSENEDPGKMHKLSDFAIGRPLGRGRFGRVYLALHKKTEIVLAIKMLSMNELVKNYMETQVLREIEIHNQLQHPNIVEFLGYFTEKRRIFLMFDFCVNGELYKFVQKQPGRVLDVRRTATYMFQAADALVYAHKKGVIHRDIKPENMLLGYWEDVKLSDFGWGIHHPKGKRKTVCGTLDYLPQEIVLKTTYSEKADEWCLGILCYELLHGSPPFESENELRTKERILRLDYSFPKSMNPQAQNMIKKLLVPQDKRITVRDIIDHPFVRQNVDTKYFQPGDPRLKHFQDNH